MLPTSDDRMIARMNFHGVKELGNGNYSNSINLFRRTLGHLLARIMYDACSSFELKFMARQICFQVSKLDCHLGPIARTDHKQQQEQQICDGSEQPQCSTGSSLQYKSLKDSVAMDFSLYHQAFLLPQGNNRDDDASSCSHLNAVDDDDDNEGNLIMTLIVVLYNMGMAYHTYGMTLSHQTYLHPFLKAAMKLYDLGFEFMQLSSQHAEAEDILLLLALANNLGHLHAHYGNPEQCEEYRTWLDELMQLGAEGRIFSAQDFEFFAQSTNLALDCKRLLGSNETLAPAA